MEELKIRPLFNNVVIEQFDAEEKSSGGILIPETVKEKPKKGTVLAVGPGKKDEFMTVKVGDIVLYGKYGGTDITIDGKDYYILKETDIYAIF